MRIVSGGGAAGHQPSAAREALEAAVPRRHADVLDDHIHAAAVSELPDLGGKILRGVIVSHDLLLAHLKKPKAQKQVWLLV